MQEEHGSGKRVLRVRSVLHTSTLTKISLVLGAALVSLAAVVSPAVALAWSVCITLLLGWAWYRGAELHAKIIEVVDDIARDMGLVRLGPERQDKPEVAGTGKEIGLPAPAAKAARAAAAEEFAERNGHAVATMGSHAPAQSGAES